MMYKLDLTPVSPLASPPVTGYGSVADLIQFFPWQPSSWPSAPADDAEFTRVLKRIFEVSMLGEINNVIEDALVRHDSLEHRGHVIAISLLCALDAISSYGYGGRSGNQIPGFIRAHFSGDYHPFAEDVLKLYRHALVHSWNLFEVALTPDDKSVVSKDGMISFGLLNFFEALKGATESFLEKLSGDSGLQKMARGRYEELRRVAKPA